MRYHSVERCTIGSRDYSVAAQIHAKLHDVSTNSGPRDTGNLITYAIACVFLEEFDARDLSIPKIRARSGVSDRSWSSYFNGHTEAVPLTQWEKIAGALGVRASTIIARAEDRLDALDDSDLALLLTLSGPAAMAVMRDSRRGNATRGGGRGVDPSGRARADQDDGVVRSADPVGRRSA